MTCHMVFQNGHNNTSLDKSRHKKRDKNKKLSNK